MEHLFMKFDFHTHHDRCGHAVGSVRDYIEAAIEKGLGMIGISDHSSFFASDVDRLHPGIAMAKSEFPHYVEEVLRLKEEYKDKIEVLLGVESDYFPGHFSLYRSVYSQYPFDYIIGSIHFSNGSQIFNRARWDGLTEEDLLKEKQLYLQLIQQSARTRFFDILGHIDAMKKNFPVYSDIQTDEIDATLKVISECDVAIEVNTSGKLNDCQDWFPSEDILQRAHFYGIKVTFGSDAHQPQRVADDWETVRRRLIEIGFKEWAVFRNRKRFMINL
jgi:histidinol-phosphatase (PHP family)